MLLSVIGLGLFGFINTISSYSEADSHAQSIANASKQSYIVEKVVENHNYYSNDTYNLSENDYQFFNTLKTATTLPVYGSGSGIKLSTHGIAKMSNVPAGFSEVRNFYNFTFINSANDLEKYNFSIVSGSFPNNDKSILITELQFFILTLGGFKYYDINTETAVTIMPQNHEDVLNLPIYQGSLSDNSYYISGIINTNFDFEKYNTDAYKLGGYEKRNELNAHIKDGAHNLLFLNSVAKNTFYTNPNIYSGSLEVLLTENSRYLASSFILNENHSMYECFMLKNEMEDNDVIVPLGLLNSSRGPFKDVFFLNFENKGTTEDPSYGYVLRFFQSSTSPAIVFNSVTEFKDWVSVPQNKTMLINKLKETNPTLKINPKNKTMEVDIAGFYIEFFNEKYLASGFDVGSDNYTFSTKIEQEQISFGKIENVIVFLTDNASERQSATSSILNHTLNGFSLSINSEFVSAFINLRFLFAMFESLFLVIGIVFAVFSSLLMMNFIATSISNKKREIGVLRAVGARGYDVFKIFAFESLIISVINTIIAIVAVIPFVLILNSFMAEQLSSNITFLMFGIKQILLMLGIAVASGVVSSFLPVLNITRKSPIDAINNR